MQDIVEAVGLEKGAIYGHFSSKEKLALEAFDFAWFAGGCPWLNASVEADDGSPALRDRARKAFRGWEEALVNIVIEGQQRAGVRLEVQPQSVATFMISTLEGTTAVSRDR